MADIIDFDEDKVTEALLNDMERGIDRKFHKWMADNLDIPPNDNSRVIHNG
jgi:hypothetical protein